LMENNQVKKKVVADNLLKITVAELKKSGVLRRNIFGSSVLQWSRGGASGSIVIEVSTVDPENMYLRLKYLNKETGGTFYPVDLPLHLDATACRFGGERFWFTCPECIGHGRHDNIGRRVGVLYLVGKFFCCRHCGNLTYKSTKLSGLKKKFGQVSETGLVNLYRRRTKQYKGKPTKRYQAYLKKEERFYDYMKVCRERLDVKNKKLIERCNRTLAWQDKMYG